MNRWQDLTGSVQRAAQAAFGSEPALYRIDGQGAGISIDQGIFRDANASSAVGLEQEAADTAPTFDCRASQLPAGALADENDTLELGPDHGGRVFAVKDQEPDGEGMVRLILQELVP